jgi:hypothetical protein
MSLGRTCTTVAVAAAALALCAPSADAVEIVAACTGTTGSSASLAAAITTANATPAVEDTITLGNGCRYELAAADNNWYGPNGLPPIASPIVIEGHGSTIARAAGAPKFRLLFVGANATGTSGYVSPGPGTLTLRDATLENGLAKGGDAFGGGGGGGMGGAIFNQGTILIERSTFTGNTAQGGSASNGTGGGGGGIGTDAPSNGAGGGFGTGTFGGATGGSGGNGGGGGGAGFLVSDTGGSASATVAGAGGGTTSGLAGFGGSSGGAGGNGGGGGATAPSGHLGDAGGAFAAGGVSGGLLVAGGGGGVGGGGAFGGAGGGGGFGGGGGGGGNNALPTPAGTGGFGGGAGAGASGVAGFGGGTGNVSLGGGGAGLGGAIFNMQARLEIRNATFTANTALGGTASTQAGQGLGGAVFNLSGELKAVDSTFAANTAASGGSSIYNLTYDTSTPRDGLATLRDAIVANGTGFNDLITDKPSTVVGGGANQGRALASLGDFDLVTTLLVKGSAEFFGSPLTADPQLGPLADNGGPTKTMAPALGSPVIDAGRAFDVTDDQRGRPRPFDAPDIANAAGGDGSDIGAFERQGGEFPAPTTTTTTGTGGGGVGGAPPTGLGLPAVQAFGPRTLVTLALRSKRVPPSGRLGVVVTNANAFAVDGELTAQTARAVAARNRKKRVLASSAVSFTVGGDAKTTVSVALPKPLARLLKRKGKLSLRLRAQVRDPARNTRTVTAAVTPKLKTKRRRRR